MGPVVRCGASCQDPRPRGLFPHRASGLISGPHRGGPLLRRQSVFSDTTLPSDRRRIGKMLLRRRSDGSVDVERLWLSGRPRGQESCNKSTSVVDDKHGEEPGGGERQEHWGAGGQEKETPTPAASVPCSSGEGAGRKASVPCSSGGGEGAAKRPNDEPRCRKQVPQGPKPRSTSAGSSGGADSEDHGHLEERVWYLLIHVPSYTNPVLVCGA